MSKEKYLKSTLSTGVCQIITMIAGLIIPILILKSYGSTINGLLNSTKQYINYLTLVEAGLGSVAIAALYKPINDKDNQKVNSILSATRIFYNKSGLIFSAMVLFMSIVFPYIIKSDINNHFTTALVLILGISGTLEFFIIGKYKVLLTSDQKQYVITNIQSLGIIINTIAIILLVNRGYSLLIVQFWSSLVYLMRAILIKTYVKKHYKNIRFQSEPNNSALSQRWDAFIHQIAGMIVFNTDIIILTIFLPLEEVSVYSIYRLVFTSVGNVCNIVTSGLNPLMGKILHSKTKEYFINFYTVFENLYFIFIVIIYSLTSILCLPFIKLYTNGITDVNYIRSSVMILFVITELLNKIRVPANGLVNVNGHFKQTRNRSIIEAAINIIMSLLLVNKMGIVGVLLGTVFSYLYRTIDFIIYSSKEILDRSIWISIKPILLNLLFGYIAISIVNSFIIIDIDTYLKWVVYAICYGIITCSIIITLNFIFNRNNMISGYRLIKSKFIKNRNLA